jgi:twitching motility protein PilT
MVSNLSAVEYIKDEEKTSHLKDFIERSRDILGTQSFDQHLVDLLRDGKITREVALEAATNPADFERALSFD